jgi:hypothetical protein
MIHESKIEIYYKVYKLKEDQEEKSIFDTKKSAKSVSVVVSASNSDKNKPKKFECC